MIKCNVVCGLLCWGPISYSLRNGSLEPAFNVVEVEEIYSTVLIAPVPLVKSSTSLRFQGHANVPHVPNEIQGVYL